MVDMPMTKAQVLATVPSPLNAFKIVNATETVGSFVQDRHTGILGEFGKQADMIPVTLTIHGGSADKVFRYEVLNNARLSPVAMSSTVYNALHGVNEYGDETTYSMKGDIRVEGFPDVKMQDMFSAAEGTQPAAMLAAASIGERFGRIYGNPFSTPAIKGLQLDFEVTKDRRWARLESARTDVNEARPGDDVTVEVLLRPYRGEAVIEKIPVHIPTSASKGPLHVLVSDGDVLDRLRRSGPGSAPKLDLASTIAVLNKEHVSNRVYVSVLDGDPEAMVADKVMPALPLSVMNVMDGMQRNARDGSARRVVDERDGNPAAGFCGLRRAVADDYDQVGCAWVSHSLCPAFFPPPRVVSSLSRPPKEGERGTLRCARSSMDVGRVAQRSAVGGSHGRANGTQST